MVNYPHSTLVCSLVPTTQRYLYIVYRLQFIYTRHLPGSATHHLLYLTPDYAALHPFVLHTVRLHTVAHTAVPSCCAFYATLHILHTRFTTRLTPCCWRFGYVTCVLRYAFTVYTLPYRLCRVLVCERPFPFTFVTTFCTVIHVPAWLPTPPVIIYTVPIPLVLFLVRPYVLRFTRLCCYLVPLPFATPLRLFCLLDVLRLLPPLPVARSPCPHLFLRFDIAGWLFTYHIGLPHGSRLRLLQLLHTGW